MAHELEQFTDGTTAFFSARQDAWHRLGTVTTGCLTAEQVMQVAYLGGRDVRTEALQAVESGAAVPNRYATTRVHPKTGNREALGLVGSSYRVVQNEEACQLLDLIVDETGAHYETAGSLRGGREVFVTMRLPDTMRIAGVGKESAYLKRMARERDLKYLLEEALTQENIRGSAFGAYNAVAEWTDHYQPARSDNHRAHKVLTDGAVNATKEKAFALLSA